MSKSLYYFLLVIITFGAGLLRFHLVQSSYYPLNDGGLFYKMVVDLQNNQYQIPQFTLYNQNQIPFVYSPAPFFFVGFINSASGISLLNIFKYLPLLFNILTIPVVCTLVLEVSGNRPISLLSTFLWSMALPSYQWQIMGGGITRSPALFFSCLCVFFLIRLYRNLTWRDYASTVIFASLTFLSHFEIFWNTALCMAIFWLFSSDRKKAMKALLMVTGGTLVLTLPYWLIILGYHQMGPILSSIGSGEFDIVKSIITLTMFNYTHEFSFTIISAFAFIGLIHLFVRKEYFLPVWFLGVVFLDPRSVTRSALLPLSILAAMAIVFVILPKMDMASTLDQDKQEHKSSILWNSKMFGLYPIILAVTICTFYASLVEAVDMNGISRDEEKDLLWIKENTSEDSNFLIFSSSKNWQYDHMAEWFPAITDRKSINTVQGSEWLGRGFYQQKQTEYKQLKNCFYEGEGCVSKWLSETNQEADYLLVVNSPCSDSRPFCSNSIVLVLKNDPYYKLWYESSTVTVFTKAD